MLISLGVTVLFVVAEIIVAAIANSLALLADALHHLVDAVIVVTALLALELVRRVEPNNDFARVYVDEDGHRPGCPTLLATRALAESIFDLVREERIMSQDCAPPLFP